MACKIANERPVLGTQYSEISDRQKAFIGNQKIFFVGTATDDSRVSVSPKGMDSLRVLTPNRVIWLSVTGSGNETSAHIQINPRMTIMFAAFEGSPMVMRLYGKAKVIHKNDAKWNELYSHFTPLPGARQIYDLHVDLVQASCGMSIPFFDYVEERDQLNKHFAKKGQQGTKDYWVKKNQKSIDGLDTNITDKNM